MRTAVIGGTGSVGRLVVDELVRRGDEVRVLSRTAPVDPVPGSTHHAIDLLTGAGLDGALQGVETVVDVANGTKRSREVLVEGSRRVLVAGASAGVGHHLLISIVGCDRVPIDYYRVKTDQERTVAEGSVPWSILRATQFHGLLAGIFASTARVGIRPRVRIPVQPIDPGVVAARLAAAAHEGPAGRLPDLAGPRRESAADLADAWSRATGRGRIGVRVPVPGKVGRALRDGGLCGDGDGVGPTFAEWLAADGGGDDGHRGDGGGGGRDGHRGDGREAAADGGRS